MKPSASFIFDAKIIWKQYRQFHSVFTWNCGKIKNKNKDGFCWNLIFYIKQGNKSRVVNCSLIKYLMHILDIKYDRHPPSLKIENSAWTGFTFPGSPKLKHEFQFVNQKQIYNPNLKSGNHFLRKVVQTERVSSFIKKIWNSLQFHYCKKKNIFFFFANIQQTSAHIHHCWNSCAWGLPDYYYCFQ